MYGDEQGEANGNNQVSSKEMDSVLANRETANETTKITLDKSSVELIVRFFVF
jgi:hypothetical protein